MEVRNPEVLKSTGNFPTVKDLTNGDVFKFVTDSYNTLYIFSDDNESITDLKTGDVYYDDTECPNIPNNWMEAPVIPINCEIVVTTEESKVEADPSTRPFVSGIIRRFDDLGRICIPKEFRRTFQLQEGDPVEIAVDNDTIILKKVAQEGV